MNLGPNQTLRNPKEILWLQETTSPTFSQGAPDPKDSTKRLPGENIKAVGARIKDNPTLAEKLPPLKVFTITDPDTGIDSTYSLSNRRLTALRLGNVKNVVTEKATEEEIFNDLWKMTNVKGGHTQPQMTTANGQRNTIPELTTTLGKFRNVMLDGATSRLLAYNNYCIANNIVGQQRQDYILEKQTNTARTYFNLR